MLYGDVAERPSIAGVCSGADVVVHLASLNEHDSAADPRRALLVNSYGTRNMLEEALCAGSPLFIYVSTFHVYGDHDGRIGEDAYPRPMADYASTHLFSEFYGLQFARAKGLPVSIVRLSNGYAAPVAKEIDRWSLLVNDLCKAAHERGVLVLKTPGLHKRDFVWIPDLAQAVTLLAAAPRDAVTRQVFNVAYGESRAIYDVALMVRDVYRGLYGKELPIERPQPRSVEKYSAPEVSIDKLRALGYRPHDMLREEIRRTLLLLES